MAEQKQDISANGINGQLARRSFMRGIGLTGIGLAGAAVAGGRLGLLDKVPGMSSAADATVHASGFNDVDILNFALNLEYLEAEFYTMATTGKTLEESGFDVSGEGSSGSTTGGQKVDFSAAYGTEKEFSGKLADIIDQITRDEQAHVMLLRQALGSAAIAKPAINLDALGTGFADFKEFLVLARAFEDTGVSAYGGAAPLIMSSTILGTAARIGLTEAYHASNLRLLVAENQVGTTTLDKYDQLPPESGGKYFTTAANGLAVIRNPSEVLAIVFHNNTSGTSQGGFFPNGVNGYFRSV